ncbi:MAG: hypothetical protein HN368_16985 [Spirochaetales bacterium]|jgi:hypothetical protein|nr:hypothetical protein [Spirochaetales bacterium]
MNRIHRLKTGAAFAIIIATLISCTGVPIPEPKDDKQAILLIPFEYIDDAPGTFFADYVIYAYRTDVASNLPFTIDVNAGSRFAVYRMLPPTTNAIRKIVQIDKVSGDKINSRKINTIDFELEGGKINILPYTCEVRLVRSTIPGEGRKPVQKISFHAINDLKYKAIVEELSARGVNPAQIVLGKNISD